jgi:hypothetical protein
MMLTAPRTGESLVAEACRAIRAGRVRLAGTLIQAVEAIWAGVVIKRIG